MYTSIIVIILFICIVLSCISAIKVLNLLPINKDNQHIIDTKMPSLQPIFASEQLQTQASIPAPIPALITTQIPVTAPEQTQIQTSVTKSEQISIPVPVTAPLPNGGYLESCFDCSYDGITLNCNCHNSLNGLRVNSSASGCIYGFANSYGQLGCHDPPPSIPLPTGNYKSTCYGCVYDGSKLTCNCQMLDGRVNVSTYASGCAEFKNNNGQLMC